MQFDLYSSGVQVFFCSPYPPPLYVINDPAGYLFLF
nr:MAG TPA: hypothetical protein [Herelleviridae sp.]